MRPPGLRELRDEGGVVGAHVEELGPGALLRLSHRHRLTGDHLGDLARRVVEVAGQDRALGTDDHAGRLQTLLHAVRTEVALGRGVGVGIDVEGVVGASLQAGLAPDAPTAVEIDDAVGTTVEGDGRTDRHARRVVTVVAPEDGEVPPGVRVLPLLDVLHPRPEGAEGHAVLFLAGDGARVTADAARLVDDEAVAHAARRLSRAGGTPRALHGSPGRRATRA